MDIRAPSSGFDNISRYPEHNSKPDTTREQHSPAASGDQAALHSRTRRSDGQPPEKLARTESASTASTADRPGSSDDAYAEHVLAIGAQSSLSSTGLDSLRGDVVRAVQSSRSRLADQHTADMIGNTVLDALSRSQSFRNAVSYGIQNNGEPLADITYRNEYERNPESSAGFDDIQELSIDDLHEHDAHDAPIVPVSEAAEDGEGRPHVSFGVAPDVGSPYMPSWQEGLIHEIVHHVAGAGDPPGAGTNRLGPTEIIARRTAQEMGWPIPDFTGYGAPERNAHLHERNLGALREAAQRHEDHAADFFERLDAISEGRQASPDFHEYGVSPAADRPHNRTHDFPGLPGAEPAPDEHQIQLDHRPPYFFTFASSRPSGAPTGFASASAASGASWATQGRFFEHGQPVDGNLHARAFTFPDGSKVVARAHEPLLTDSDGLKFGRFMTVASSAAVGGVAGFMAGGPPGAMAGAVAAAIPASTLAHAYEFDRIWQGYTFDYYEKGGEKPFYTRHMYAWDSDAKRVEKLTTMKDPKEWLDYANFTPDGNWDWWKWRAGNAPLRT